jgi:hypothetical protein
MRIAPWGIQLLGFASYFNKRHARHKKTGELTSKSIALLEARRAENLRQSLVRISDN